MADRNTLTMKTAAIAIVAERFGYKSRTAISRRLREIDRYANLGLPFPQIKALVIDMRAWCWEGPLAEARWFDDRLVELADYLSTPEEQVELRELAARLERDILAFHGRAA